MSKQFLLVLRGCDMIENCSVWEFEVESPSISEADTEMEDWHAFVIGFHNNAFLLASSSPEKVLISLVLCVHFSPFPWENTH